MDMAAPLLAQTAIAGGNLVLAGVISLAAGIVILVVPRVLNYVVAAYLIIVGVLWIVSGL